MTPSRDQRLNNFVSVCMTERDLAAAAIGVMRTGDFKIGFGAALARSRPRNRSPRRFDFSRTAAMAMPSKVATPSAKRHHAEHSGRSTQSLCDSGRRGVPIHEIERHGMAHPAAQRLAQLQLMTARDIKKGRGTRSAVQIFVAAPDGEIGFVAIEKQLHRARAVTQIPHDEGARNRARPS